MDSITLSPTAILIAAAALLLCSVVVTAAAVTLGRRSRQPRRSATDASITGFLESQAQTLGARLEEFAARIGELDARRREESAVLQTKFDDLSTSTRSVAEEARTLANTMRDNQARGLWGEMQLERVLRMSGLDEHISYDTQVSVDGGRARPDAVVHLPTGRSIVIDAKTPLGSYLAGASTTDPVAREQHFADHAKAVGNHVRALAGRGYDEVVPGAVDIVIVFLPSDALLAEAYRAQPQLLDQALELRIVLASPSTLLAHLRGVALGWREERLAEEARTIAELGRELHQRFSTFATHLANVGSALGRAVETYNKAVGSLERSVMPQARRFEELGAGSRKTLTAVEQIEDRPRSISA